MSQRKVCWDWQVSEVICTDGCDDLRELLLRSSNVILQITVLVIYRNKIPFS